MNLEKQHPYVLETDVVVLVDVAEHRKRWIVILARVINLTRRCCRCSVKYVKDAEVHSMH